MKLKTKKLIKDFSLVSKAGKLVYLMNTLQNMVVALTVVFVAIRFILCLINPDEKNKQA